MDTSKRNVKVAVPKPGRCKSTHSIVVTTFGATTKQLLGLIDYLKAERVTTDALEATSDY